MRLSNGLLNWNKKGRILSSKGKEWSQESAAVIDVFMQWLAVSHMEKTMCLNRINSETFNIVYHHDKDKSEIVLSDEAGCIGSPFLWDRESGIEREHYLTDAGFLLFYIGSLCHNEHSIEKINSFIRDNIL